ncbi:MAG: hypothetical protein IJJ33_08615 [Victivallales bacterium]|nr:hypothetical protein [Victivallales bacterium]
MRERIRHLMIWCHALVALVLCVVSIWLFCLTRNIMSARDLRLMSQTLEQYSLTIDNSMDAYNALASSLPKIAESSRNLSELCDKLMPLSKDLVELSRSRIQIPFVKERFQPFERLNQAAETLYAALPGFRDAFLSSSQSLEKYQDNMDENVRLAAAMTSENLHQCSLALEKAADIRTLAPVLCLILGVTAALGFAASALKEWLG